MRVRSEGAGKWKKRMFAFKATYCGAVIKFFCLELELNFNFVNHVFTMKSQSERGTE